MMIEPTAISRTRKITAGDQDERSLARAYTRSARDFAQRNLAADRRRRSARYPLQDLGIDVEVRVHRVDVVLLLQPVDQLDQLHGAGLVQRDQGLRPLGDLGLLDLHAGRLER